MTFGSNPADIIIVLEFAQRLYRQCKNAGDAYLEIGREIRALHTVLRHLKYEVQAPESILNRDRALYARDLAPLIADCRFTLEDLEELVLKYGGLRSDEKSSSGRLWNQIKFGTVEMDQLGSVRVKLINHKTNITALLDTIQLRESSRVAATLDNHGGQLDIILDKVDNIASRMGQRAASLMTTYEDDDKEVWKSFRRELVAEGFSSDVLTRHKVSTDVLALISVSGADINRRMCCEPILDKSTRTDCSKIYPFPRNQDSQYYQSIPRNGSSKFSHLRLLPVHILSTP